MSDGAEESTLEEMVLGSKVKYIYGADSRVWLRAED